MVLLSSEFKNYQIYPHASESTLNRRSYAWSHSHRIGAVVRLLHYNNMSCTDGKSRRRLTAVVVARHMSPFTSLKMWGVWHSPPVPPSYCELSDMQFSTTHVTPQKQRCVPFEPPNLWPSDESHTLSHVNISWWCSSTYWKNWKNFMILYLLIRSIAT